MASARADPLSFQVLAGPEAQGHQPPSRKNTARLVLIIGGVAALVAIVVVIVFLARDSSQGYSCTINNCKTVTLPKGADCTKAVCAACNDNFQPSEDSQGKYCALNCTSQLAYCAKPKLMPRDATGCAQAGCEECVQGAETVMDNQTFLPLGTCKFSCTQNQLNNGCAPGSCTDAATCSKCVPGFQLLGGNLRGANGSPCQKINCNTPMTFFMYRAQSDVSYPPEDVDLASSSGVMWYLHNEVVNVGCQCSPGQACGAKQRHYGITQVLRYKVTVYNTPKVFEVRSGQFGHFYTFDRGQCTNKDCQNQWDTYGYAVGCQPLTPAGHNNYPNGGWYSLPGKCPSLPYSDPNKATCGGKDQPGGQCDVPAGTETCTWRADPAGSIRVDDFCGITDYQAFCAANNAEYNQLLDKGKGCSFWDDKNNATRNRERTNRMEQLFAQKFPGEHSYNVPDPLCDGF